VPTQSTPVSASRGAPQAVAAMASPHARRRHIARAQARLGMRRPLVSKHDRPGQTTAAAHRGGLPASPLLCSWLENGRRPLTIPIATAIPAVQSNEVNPPPRPPRRDSSAFRRRINAVRSVSSADMSE
jgi:hypothetical protein